MYYHTAFTVELQYFISISLINLQFISKEDN